MSMHVLAADADHNIMQTCMPEASAIGLPYNSVLLHVQSQMSVFEIKYAGLQLLIRHVLPGCAVQSRQKVQIHWIWQH